MEKPEAQQEVSAYEQSYSKDPKKPLLTLAMRLQRNVLKEKERFEDELSCLGLKTASRAFTHKRPKPLKLAVS